MWDLLDEGIENVLGNVKDCGLDEINLATEYHVGKFILPHNSRNRIKFIEDGVVYFPVKREAFKDVGIYPEVSKLVSEEPDALEKIFKCAAKLGIKINSWHVMMHNTPMGRRYPELTVRNAFGDHYYHSLCPNKLQVQDYFSELFKAMTTSLDINEIFMESPGYMPYTHRAHHEHKSIDFSIVVLLL